MEINTIIFVIGILSYLTTEFRNANHWSVDSCYEGRSSFSTLPRQLDKFNLRAHCFRRTVKQERNLSSYLLLFARHFKQRVLHSRRNKDRQFIDSLTIVVFNEKHCTRYNIRRSTKFAQHINHIVIKMASYILIRIYHIERTSL